MLKSEPMSRILVVSSRDHLRTTIETLHALKVADITGYSEGSLEGFRIGRPLPEASKASEHLVRIRALIRHLGIEGNRPKRRSSVAEIETRIADSLAASEREIGAVHEQAEASRQSLDALAAERDQLEPLAGLPLRLEDYGGYASLAVIVGRAAGDVRSAVAGLRFDHDLFVSESSNAFALFVPADRREEALDPLFRIGFEELPVPEGRGLPSERLKEIRSEEALAQTRRDEAEAGLARYAAEHGDFLLAAEEHLAIEVEKAEAPLSFATTDNAFAVDAWIPTVDVERARRVLGAATHDAVHIDILEEPHAGHDGHAPLAESPTHGAHPPTPDVQAKEADEPPTKYRNPGAARPFEFFTSLFSTPRWNEVDPTIVLALVFPLFYGFMIGDLGYGILMIALGLLLFKKVRHIVEIRNLGFAIAIAGVVAAFFGGVVFHDAFGVPFESHHHVEGDMTCTQFAQTYSETTWQCLAGGGDALVAEGHPLLSKLGDVPDLLVISILAAFVHLGLGLVFGFFNERGHSVKHAGAKVFWFVLLIGFFILIVSQAHELSERVAGPVWAVIEPIAENAGGLGVLVGGLVAIAVAGLLWAEGGIAILELPALFSNMLSYTRLAGIVVAKAAMVIAFNGMFLVDMIILGEGSILLAIFGIVFLLLTQLLVFALGLLSSGIQAIRLNYVEFFTKFYKGGGRPFTPFGRDREFTTV